jgi:tRNA pseudouridine38-40 synthase
MKFGFGAVFTSDERRISLEKLEATMRTIKLTIAYDGTQYAGWQYQPNAVTVQETLEKAVEKVTGKHSSTLASGRTDAGVHALGQVVGFRTESQLPPEVFVRALNANLPQDIAVLDAVEVSNDFHAIAHVIRKRYRYVIHDGPVRDVFARSFAWHYCYGRLDAEAMQRAALPLIGTHDFSSFESSGAERKTVNRAELASGQCPLASGSCNISPRPLAGEGQGVRAAGATTGSSPFIAIEVEADGFLYNMVRAIVGTLVQVGRGVQPEYWPGQVLEAMDRRVAGPNAPPEGLCLLWVEYEETNKRACPPFPG